ncbi:MAG: MotA/TolQ/ExbB proton channel family protein [Synergistetes bacterium]|nr:MotA/TolQ/ExbB proton channel family protein [Synergistota bacterium]
MRRLEWFEKGGPLMYPIFICSILSLAIFLERLFYLLKRRQIIERFRRKIEGLSGDIKELREILMVLVEGEAMRLSKGLGALSLIARVSTLLGLLGTVLGMVEVFKEVSEGKLGDPEALAGGIWVALITTVFGLSVAIPAVFMHGFLSSLVSRREEELLKIGEEVLIEKAKSDR